MMQQDGTVRNRLYMTKKGRVVEATGFVKSENNDHYLEAVDQRTGKKELYAKRNLRPQGYVRRTTALSELGQLLHGG
jgi:hypothetical protein